MSARSGLVAALAVGLLVPTAAHADGARIRLLVTDPPGVGFNDPTPAAPIGGNIGTTVGQQRLIAFQYAASEWGRTLDSAVEIRISASFDPTLECTAVRAIIGSAGPWNVFKNFDGAPVADTWYVSALADRLAYADLGGPDQPDLHARFNADIGQPDCLPHVSYYYGLDHAQGVNQVNLVGTLLHEFAHGLGFLSLVQRSPGAEGQSQLGSYFWGFPDAFTRFIYDNSRRKSWTDMTEAERVASMATPGQVVFTGVQAVSGALQRLTRLARVRTGAAATGPLAIESEPALAPSLGSVGRRVAPLVRSNDGLFAPRDGDAQPAETENASATDGCGAQTVDMTGKIAVIDGGGCAHAYKLQHAQDAGAIAAIVIARADEAPVAMAPSPGLVPAFAVSIPAVMVAHADGAAVLAARTLTLELHPVARRGTDLLGRPLLHTPAVISPGSSVSHFDIGSTPNLHMEPNARLTPDLTDDLDLTPLVLRDLGWFADRDLDRHGDDVDTCPFIPDPEQEDTDGDGAGDLCDLDDDDDGVLDVADGCPFAADPEQLDRDGDGLGDACDPAEDCPASP